MSDISELALDMLAVPGNPAVQERLVKAAQEKAMRIIADWCRRRKVYIGPAEHWTLAVKATDRAVCAYVGGSFTARLKAECWKAASERLRASCAF